MLYCLFIGNINYGIQRALVKEANSNAIDLSGYKPGIYLLWVTSEIGTARSIELED